MEDLILLGDRMKKYAINLGVSKENSAQEERESGAEVTYLRDTLMNYAEECNQAIAERDSLRKRVAALENAIIGASTIQDSDTSCGRFTWCPFCGDGRGKAKRQIKHAPGCIVPTCEKQ